MNFYCRVNFFQVCKFCDMVLKKSRKENTEPKEAEEQLDNAITVFRYIEDKDIFQRVRCNVPSY